ncbi:histidine phosphatase family protein [Pseudomonas gorinensis]
MYLYLIRHGETWANAEQRYLGSLDPGLIELGRQQAEALSRDNGVFPRTGCLRIPRHPATQSTNIRPPVPRSSGQAVGAQRRRFALLV